MSNVRNARDAVRGLARAKLPKEEATGSVAKASNKVSTELRPSESETPSGALGPDGTQGGATEDSGDSVSVAQFDREKDILEQKILAGVDRALADQKSDWIKWFVGIAVMSFLAIAALVSSSSQNIRDDFSATAESIRDQMRRDIDRLDQDVSELDQRLRDFDARADSVGGD